MFCELDSFTMILPSEPPPGDSGHGRCDPTPPEQALAPIEAADDPHRLARLYLAERCQHHDGLTLRFWREQWHRWDGFAFREFPDAELRAELTAAAKREMDRTNLFAQMRAAQNSEIPPTSRKSPRA
jgi:hypothetical protein